MLSVLGQIMKIYINGLYSMTKYEIISDVAKQSGLTHKQVNDCLKALLSVMKKTLKCEKRISIRGLGVFRVQESPLRKVFNIQTKKKQEVLPRKTVKFKMCPWLLSLDRYF